MVRFHFLIKDVQRSKSSELPKKPMRMLTVEMVPRVLDRSIWERTERTRSKRSGEEDLERMRRRRV